jgi:protein phosphatase 1L
MLKNLFVIMLVSILSLNAAQPAPINSLPFVILRDQGTCSYMQDRSCAKIKADHAFFGIFDGHGTPENGHIVADFLSKNFYENIITTNSMVDAFAQIDKQITAKLNDDFIQKTGSTASVASIKDNKMTIGHVGDCKIVLIRNGEVIELTQDHSLDYGGSEYMRIITLSRSNHVRLEDVLKVKNGTLLVKSIINKSERLAMTRAFGDRDFLPYVISDPQIRNLDLTEQDEFLILATDGIWDVIKPQKAYDILKSTDDWVANAQAIIRTAKHLWNQYGRTDNIEIVVVNLKALFRWQTKLQQEKKSEVNNQDEEDLE